MVTKVGSLEINYSITMKFIKKVVVYERDISI